MAAPLSALAIAQVGLESTRGTAVAATSILDMDPFGASMSRNPNLIRIRKAGSLATAHRTELGRDEIGVDVNGQLTYQWLPWWFNLALGALATGTGAGANKTWTFDSSIVSDSADTLKSATFELGGKDTWPSEYQIAGCVLQKLSISIKPDAPWMYSASLLGKAITAQSKTNSLSVVDGLKSILGTTTKAYFDTSSAFGTTQRTGTVLSADIDIELGVERRYTLDGARTAYRIGVTGPRKISAKIVTEYAAQGDFTSTHAATAQRVQLVATGATLGTGNYAATISLPGVYTAHTLGEDNGVITQELTLEGQYDSTPGADITAVVVNDSASLP